MNVAPIRDLPKSYFRQKYYPAPWDRHDRRPTVLVTTPYAVFPPTHGGAHRIHQLLSYVTQRYQVILLSDEGQGYGKTAASWFVPFRAVHLIAGRKETAGDEPPRIARMRSHSHQTLGNELARIVKVYCPDLVQIEYVELALLAQWRKRRIPWVLTLHDVLLSGCPPESPEDRSEQRWLNKFDHLIACCDEDAALLRGMPVSVVENGAAITCERYSSSAGMTDLLFLGPFRYQPNWQGIQEFLRESYPELRSRLPDLHVHILGGVDARSRANRCEAFQQPGVFVYDHVEDVAPWLRGCALTLNPIGNNRGSCLKVIQSLAAGRICVSTREGARGFLGSDFRSLVAVDTVADFTEAIAGLLNCEDTRLNLEAPETEKLKRYTWALSAERQMAAYQNLIPNGRQ